MQGEGGSPLGESGDVAKELAHGLSHEIGSLEIGKLADIVLWDPAWFGAKPWLVLKSGYPAWGVTGDPNASVDRAEPLVLGPQFGAHGAAPAELAVAFVSDVFDAQLSKTRRRHVAVKDCREVGLQSMVLNSTEGATHVDADGARVTFDGEELRAAPADSVSLNRLYFL